MFIIHPEENVASKPCIEDSSHALEHVPTLVVEKSMDSTKPISTIA
jgi:hypothetical protein